METAEFWQFMQEKGCLSVPVWLLEKHQALDISPEELGYFLLALHQEKLPRTTDVDPYPPSLSQGDNRWIGWALEKGLAAWKGEGAEKRVVFSPLWEKLCHAWADEEREKSREARMQARSPGESGPGHDESFDYSRIVKELDRLRGGLSVTAREKQLIQEFNLKYGWSSDFILNFFRLCAKRELMQVKNYQSLAARIYRSGIFTLDGLASFMDEVDWITRQAAEIKRDYLGLYGMVTVMEREYYVKWHISWKFSHMLIVRAAKESVGASHASFKYVETILERWHSLGVHSLEDCEEAIRLWNEEKKKGKTGAVAKGREGQQRRKNDKERGASLWDGYAVEGGRSD